MAVTFSDLMACAALYCYGFQVSDMLTHVEVQLASSCLLAVKAGAVSAGVCKSLLCCAMLCCACRIVYLPGLEEEDLSLDDIIRDGHMMLMPKLR